VPTFAILAHTDPVLLARLVDRLAPFPVALHVDARSDVTPFLGLPRTTYVQSRVRTFWGGFSIAEAIRRTLALAIPLTAEEDHIVILSGQCYPTRPLEELVEHFKQSRFRQHCDAGLVFDSVGYAAHRLRKQWLYDALPHERNDVVVVRKAKSAIRRLAAALLPRRHPEDFGELRPVAGSMHLALTAACAEYVLTRWRDEPTIPLFHRALGAEEIVIPSLVYNSPWVQDTPHGRIVPRGNRLTSTLAMLHHTDPLLQGFRTLNDLTEIRQSQKFFTRKVSMASSEPLLDELDRILSGSG
jgi:hypothetical protein